MAFLCPFFDTVELEYRYVLFLSDKYLTTRYQSLISAVHEHFGDIEFIVFMFFYLFFFYFSVFSYIFTVPVANKGIIMHALNCVVALPPPIECPADVIFVLDGSGSIGTTNFNLTKSFLSTLVSRLDINSGNARVGLVTFSSGVGTTINLDAHSSVNSLRSAISSLSYAGGGTNTAAALAHVRTTMLTSAAGDRSNVPNVVVVLTDGNSGNARATQVSSVGNIIYCILVCFYI